MKRKLFALLCVLLCLIASFSFTLVSSAAGIVFDWTDYINTYSVDGDYITVYCSFPISYIEQVVQNSSGETIVEGSYYVRIPTPDINRIVDDYIFFFGQSNFLDMSNVPEGTTLNFQFMYLTENSSLTTAPIGQMRAVYYAQAGGNAFNEYDSQYIDAPQNTVISVPVQLIKSSGDNSFVQPYFKLANLSSPNSVLISIRSFSLTFTSDALGDLFPNADNETNQLLVDLINLNNKILNGSAADIENSQNGQLVEQEKTDSMNELNDYIASVDRVSPEDVFNSTNPDNLITDTSLMMVGNTFGHIFSTNLVSTILILCVSFSVISYILFGKKG